MRFTNDNSMMPNPKNTDRMMPMAASSLIRLDERIRCMNHAPTNALMAAPPIMTGRCFSPTSTNPMITPGKAAWDNASLIRLCLFQ